jgi:hypothetical protein
MIKSKICEKYNESRGFVKEERAKGLDESNPYKRILQGFDLSNPEMLCCHCEEVI